jgi:vacuolar-type H+-ATPase subunit C/Vma6
MIARGMRYAEAASRVRVRLGGLLTARDYASMMSAAGPEQMLAQLRATRYGGAVQRVASTTASFADALHQDYFASAKRIGDLQPRAARNLCRIFLDRFTIDSLKVILRTAGNTPDRPRLSRVLGPFVDSDLPLERLIDAATIRDVVEALWETAYAEPLRAVIRRLSPDEGSSSALLFHMELALDRWFFERLWLACRNMPTADSRIARRLLGAFADVTNILWARRLRETFQLPPADVAAHLIPYGFHLTDRQRHALGSSAADRPLPSPFSGMSPDQAYRLADVRRARLADGADAIRHSGHLHASRGTQRYPDCKERRSSEGRLNSRALRETTPVPHREAPPNVSAQSRRPCGSRARLNS